MMKKSRSNSKIIYTIISILLSAIFIFQAPIQEPVIAYALGTNGQDNDTNIGGGGNNHPGGYSFAKTAYLCYIVDEDFNLLVNPKIVALTTDTNNVLKTENLESWNTDYLKSKPEYLGKSNGKETKKEVVKYTDDRGLRNPFVCKNTSKGEVQVGQADKVKKWSKTKIPKSDYQELTYLIYMLWDEGDTYKTFLSAVVGQKEDPKSVTAKFLFGTDNRYFIYEAIYWMNTGNTTRVATSTGWAKYAQNNKLGDNQTLQKIYPSCITFKKTQFGLKPAPHKNNDYDKIIKNYAAGMISIWNHEDNPIFTQTTYNEPTKYPAKPKDESKSANPKTQAKKYNIVKNYVIHDPEDDSYTTVGIKNEKGNAQDCYRFENSVSRMYLEDEDGKGTKQSPSPGSGYKVMKWIVTEESEARKIESVEYVQDKEAIKAAQQEVKDAQASLDEVMSASQSANGNVSSIVGSAGTSYGTNDDSLSSALDNQDTANSELEAAQQQLEEAQKALEEAQDKTVGKLVWKENVLHREATATKKEKNYTKLKGGEQAWDSAHDIAKYTDESGKIKGRTLYILLVKEKSGNQTTRDESKTVPHKAPNESSGGYTIIKNYIVKQDGVYKNASAKTSKIKKSVSSKITIEDEADKKYTGYKLKAWIVTDDISNKGVTAVKNHQLVWGDNVPGNRRKQGTTECTVDLKKLKGKTLYVLLEKVKDTPRLTGDFVIPESSVSKTENFCDSLTSKPKKLNEVKFQWIAQAFNECLGHTHNHYYWCSHKNYSHQVAYSVTHYCGPWDWVDAHIHFSLTNTKAYNQEYKDIIAQKMSTFENVVETPGAIPKWWEDVDRETNKKDIQPKPDGKIGVDYRIVFKRGKDKLTVAAWKNDSGVNNLMGNELEFRVANSNPSNPSTRKTTDYIEKFDTKFVSEGDVYTTRAPLSAAPCIGLMCPPEISTYVLKVNGKNYFEINGIEVAVQVYSGKSSLDTTEQQGEGLSEAGEINFTPYVTMKYDQYFMTYANYASQFNPWFQTVNVLGNYNRDIKFYNYAEVRADEENNQVSKKTSHADKVNSKGYLKVSSSQWSTHATITSNLSTLLESDYDPSTCLALPGGVTYSVSTPSDNTQKITVETMQVYLSKDGKIQVDNTKGTSTLTTLDDARDAHDDFVQQVHDSLEDATIDQWVNEDPTGDPFKGTKVLGGIEFDGKTLSTDSKYYFGQSADGHLDAELDTEVEVGYRFRTNTRGQLLMAKVDVDNEQSIPSYDSLGTNEVVILEKGQDASDLTNDIAIEIEAKTNVVSQLVDGLERNTGSDPTAKWATDGKWYNEAFDGVIVLWSTSKLNVGLWNPSDRSSVSDPRLTPSHSSKSDFSKAVKNKDEAKKKFYVSQFKISLGADIQGEDNKLGEFGDTSIYLKNLDLDGLFVSDKFWIPNVTAQDLK